MKSLLDKAIHGTGTSDTPSPTSLFSRALAVRSPVFEELEELEEAEIAEVLEITEEPETVETDGGTPFDTSGFDDLRRELSAIPDNSDSILELWSIISERLPLAALALFLPRESFLFLAAQNGFPSGTDDSVPPSLFSAFNASLEPLDSETRALFAPILGVPFSLSLRASAMRSTADLLGLWIYHDPVLEAKKAENRAELDALLSRAGESISAPSLTALSMTAPIVNPARILLGAALRYPSASAFAFDLSSFDIGEQARLRGIKPIVLRSFFLEACGKILAQSGMAVAFGERSVGCILGSASTIDTDLAFFQFKKTLKRIVPYLAAASFPEGRVLRLDPASEGVLEDLTRFLAE
jgi:hypothetical protein